MKRFKRMFIVLTIMVSLTGLCADGPNLAKLETSLKDASEDMFNPGSLLKVLETQYIGTQTNSKLLVEMAVQSRYPFVAIAGLAGLNKLNTELAYRVSLNHLWCSTNIGSPVVIPFLECLTNKIAPNAFANAFSAVSLCKPEDIKNAIIVIQQIRIEQLAEWLFAPESGAGAMTVEALVIDRLIGNQEQLTLVQRAELQTKLKSLRFFPGVPKAIYVLHSDEAFSTLGPYLKAVVEDAVVDFALKQMLFKKHAKDVNKALDVDALEISEKERQRLKSWLIRYSK